MTVFCFRETVTTISELETAETVLTTTLTTSLLLHDIIRNN